MILIDIDLTLGKYIKFISTMPNQNSIILSDKEQFSVLSQWPHIVVYY